MSSCSNILVAAGFSAAEIQILFQQAADQLASGEAMHGWHQETVTGNLGGALVDADAIRIQFAELPTVQALQKLKTRAEALERPSDSREALAKCFDLVSRVVPNIAEAQAWIMSTAEAAGVRVEASKAAWIEAATDDELDDESAVIFLDDFEITYPLGFDVIENVVHALIDIGDKDRFDQLYKAIMARGIKLPGETSDSLESGRKTLDLLDAFYDFIFSRPEEFMETPVLEEFVRTHDFPQPSYFLIGWLRKMEEAGRIERYKRANRWRVQILKQSIGD